MPHTLNTLSAFTAGEWSPTLDSRVDLPNYRKAARKLRNMVPMKQGGATRRPGTQFVAQGGQTRGAFTSPLSRLIKFQYAPGTTYILEFFQNGIRFYTGGTTATQIQTVQSTLPAYTNGTWYAIGAYVVYAGVTYYCFNGPVLASSTNRPGTSIGNNFWRSQTAFQVPTPYNANNFTAPNYWAADIFSLQFEQINDVVYIVHPNYPVWKLTRYSDTNWVMQQVQFLTPAMLDENATDMTLTASAVSGSITLSANPNAAWANSTVYVPGNTVSGSPDGVNTYIYNCIVSNTSNSSGAFGQDLALGYWTQQNTFLSGHVGSYWQLAYNRPTSNIEFDAATISSGSYNFGSGSWNGGTTTLYVIGTWEIQTYGTWTGNFTAQVSYDNGTTYQNIVTLTSKNDANYSISGQELTGGLYTFSFIGGSTATVASSTPPRVVLTANNQYVYGLVEITGVSTLYTATATVVGHALYATTPTTFWSEGAWSNVRGYPQAVTVYQQRMWYGATAFQPQRIWATQTNDIENFALIDQSQPTYGLAFDLNAPSRGPINWLNAQTDLMAGLAAAEWIIGSGQPNTAISPTSITAVEHSANGSIQGQTGKIIGNAAFYVQRRGTSFQQMLFSVFTNKYMSQDVLSYSQHLTNSGIKNFDYQQEFENQSILWAVCGDGTLISMTYSLEQEMFAWARHDTGQDNGDKFISVAVIYGANGADDEVWVSVLRNPANATTCQIERVYPIAWQNYNVGQPDLTQACFADCATQYFPTTGGTNVLSGLPVCLYNRFVTAALIPASGTGMISYRIVSCNNYGNVVLDNYVPKTGDCVWVGLPIQWYLQPMRLDVDQRAGEVVGLTRAISKLYVRVVNSIGGQWATSQGDIVDIQSYPITENSGNPPPFYPNVPLDLELDVGGLTQYELDATFTLQGTDPLPMTVLGVTIKQDIGGAP